ncbi:50S ribosomal protein L9 [Treponema berlinense]|jgi:large subunit ribosomal protein L9|uniref:Large ribosomal subunit protein bL9 n=1 Tax=Treponema berlinense TaxID=225004 RepID=A0A1T4KVL9_9SPIR|nr:50S ribosomal protein L9 [Treponema berlinense]MDD5835514.1 50S ribosomal protein L9 [Treponema berlinense]MDY3707020.1 50S ribosomal protein L9 [Treponema berlinense]SJZ46408.1 large subunit ribosomal protein L9 [Treponema berlinense]
MKVILNEDVKHLGEMGDVKNVANGYARNFLFPHMFAVPYNADTVAYFEGRKAEIEARKEAKRKDAASTKDKLEATLVDLTVPAAANGKLYGAVTSQTVADFLNKNGFDIERKRIEIQGVTIKSVGHYTALIHLYESTNAEVKISVKGQTTDSKAEEVSSKKEAPAEPAETPAEEKAE